MRKLLVLLVLTYSCGHECKWSKCPYKGITRSQWDASIRSYTECDEGTDGYLIDYLHLEHPEMEYDQLDSMLFTKQTK